MAKVEKSARGIILPIRSGMPAKMINVEGDTIKTSTCKIENITYAQNGYFATVSTRNSIYTDVHIPDYPVSGENTFDTLSEGDYIKGNKGEMIKVGKIVSITSDGISIEEAVTGKIYTGLIK